MMAFFGLRQNLNQRRAVQIFQHRHHRHAADEFGDEAELDQIHRLHMREQVDIAAAADAVLPWRGPFSSSCRKPMDFLPVRRAITFSRPTNAPPQMNRMLVVSTGREFLVGMLAAALRRNVGDGAFQNLQQRLLHAFARNIARDRRILVLAADLVDFVDIDDALLALLHVAIGGLQQLQDDVLDVFAHVPGFGQRGGVHDGERHVQNLGQRLRHQGLAGSGGADQQNVGFLQARPRCCASGSCGCACSGCRPRPPASSWWLPAR